MGGPGAQRGLTAAGWRPPVHQVSPVLMAAVKQASLLSSHLQIKPEPLGRPSRSLWERQRHSPKRKRCRTPEAEGVWERSPPRRDESGYRLLSHHSDHIYYDERNILSSQMTAERLTGHMGPSTAPPPPTVRRALLDVLVGCVQKWQEVTVSSYLLLSGLLLKLTLSTFLYT